MKHSESLANIAPALVKAQSALKNPDKNQQGYGYKYADLATIIDMSKPVLAKHGLSIIQAPEPTDNGNIKVTTIIMHESGEYMAGTISMPVPEMKSVNASQMAGAAYTYARRYAISAMLNIAADEDTDAATPQKNPAQKNGAVARKSGAITTKQTQLVNMLLAKKGRTKNELYNKYDVTTTKDLTMDQASMIIDNLNKLPDATLH